VGLTLLIVVVAVNGNGGGGRGGSDDENDGNSRNGANWEIEQIKGTDGEGTMFDDGRTGNGSDC
jgi:hypothetical protein